MARAKKKEGKSVIYTTEEEVGTPVQFPLFLPIEVRKSTLLIRPIMKALEKSSDHRSTSIGKDRRTRLTHTVLPQSKTKLWDRYHSQTPFFYKINFKCLFFIHIGLAIYLLFWSVKYFSVLKFGLEITYVLFQFSFLAKQK